MRPSIPTHACEARRRYNELLLATFAESELSIRKVLSEDIYDCHLKEKRQALRWCWTDDENRWQELVNLYLYLLHLFCNVFLLLYYLHPVRMKWDSLDVAQNRELMYDLITQLTRLCVGPGGPLCHKEVRCQWGLWGLEARELWTWRKHVINHLTWGR
jgi:hypothetical protein